MASTSIQSIKTAARKLPIKRKSPDHSNPNPNPNSVPKIESTNYEDEDFDLDEIKPPPFKFHRIWTESDEIRFLHGLLDSSSQGLIFPRDLHIFYNCFSTSMSQPYTKSQLSEKLRRLRKKFRVISARISRGLDPSLLTSHDRSLLELSKMLWHPDHSSSSPFNVNNAKKKSTSVSVKVSFNPTFNPSMSSPVPLPPPNTTHSTDHENDCNGDADCNVVEITNVEIADDGHVEESHLLNNGNGGDGVGRIAAQTVMDVFDKSLKEVEMVLESRGLLNSGKKSSFTMNGSSQQEKAVDLMKRCREQRIAELNVVARRLRLVLEHSIRE